MVNAIIEALSAAGDWFVSMFNSLVALFWVDGVGEAAGHLTFVGVLALIGVSIGLVFGLVRLIRGFLRMRG